MTQERRFYYIEDMSAILGKSAMAIHGHLARKQYDAVPPPMRLGRRLVWLVEAVDEWISIKVADAKAEVERHKEFMNAPPRRRGRPTKTEEIKKRKEDEVRDMLKTLGQSLKDEDEGV